MSSSKFMIIQDYHNSATAHIAFYNRIKVHVNIETTQPINRTIIFWDLEIFGDWVHHFVVPYDIICVVKICSFYTVHYHERKMISQTEMKCKCFEVEPKSFSVEENMGFFTSNFNINWKHFGRRGLLYLFRCIDLFVLTKFRWNFV